MTTPASQHARNARIAAAQLLVLAALCLAMFRSEFAYIAYSVTTDPEAAHALAAPVLILLLVLLRRRALAESLSSGSFWGFVLLCLAIAVYSMSMWPFNYAYPRRVSIIPAFAGVILSVGGWRMLKLCLPMFLVLILAIPTGSRYWARLIITPETYTLSAAEVVLDMLPGVSVTLDGLDLSYATDSGPGTIALGEPLRGASLLLSFLMIGVFITFTRIRPMWQVIVMAIAAGPIALLCNFSRLLTWGVVTIYGDAEPISGAPRIIATISSLLLAYVLFAALLGVLSRIVLEAPPVQQDTAKAQEYRS